MKRYWLQLGWFCLSKNILPSGHSEIILEFGSKMFLKVMKRWNSPLLCNLLIKYLTQTGEPDWVKESCTHVIHLSGECPHCHALKSFGEGFSQPFLLVLFLFVENTYILVGAVTRRWASNAHALGLKNLGVEECASEKKGVRSKPMMMMIQQLNWKHELFRYCQ